MEHQANAPRPFGMRDKISYAFGDIANDCTFILSSTFLLKFHTGVMGVRAGLVGLMMMVARFVDAFTDMTMGRVVDATRPGKPGKFRKWMLIGSGPVAVMSFLLYPVWFQDAAMGLKVVWMFASYLLWGSVFHTTVSIPYGSMASAITHDPRQRTQLSVFRTVGAAIAGLAIGAGVPLVAYNTDADGNKVLNGVTFSKIAFCFSVAAVICYIICIFGVTERVKPHSRKPAAAAAPSGGFVRRLVTNRPLVGIIVAAIFLLPTQLTISGMARYIYPNYYKNVTAQAVVTLAGSMVTLVLSTFATPLARRFGKKELRIAGCTISALSFAACLLVRPDNVWVYVAFVAAAYLGVGIFNILIWACIIDVIDYAEVKNGIREDGTTYSVYSFVRKLGQAAAAGLTGLLVDRAGYTALTANDPEVLRRIFNISCIVPFVGFVGVVLALVYPLTRDAVEANSAELAHRRDQH